jgi:hypothetical protein
MNDQKLAALQLELFSYFTFLAERMAVSGPEICVLQISSLYEDSTQFKHEYEKIVSAIMNEGRKALESRELKDREVVHLAVRFLFAAEIVRELLDRRALKKSLDERISALAKQLPSDSPEMQEIWRQYIKRFSQPLFVGFDDSQLSGDRSSVLHALLIGAWKKTDREGFEKLSRDCLHLIPLLAGFHGRPPELGQNETGR